MQTKKGQSGFSLIELLIVVAIIGIIAAIAIPNLLAARRASNESAAIATMKTILNAEETYRSTLGEGNEYADQADLLTEKLLDSVIGTAGTIKSGYSYTAAVVGANNQWFDATGVSQQTSTGSRSFFVNEAGVVYGSASGTLTAPTCTATDARTVAGGDPVKN
ncbi:MAG TPA: prepilin-type N-terminal cleavage/methylation domain-containing protein [Pyrinomonadaceae bacterium]|jgi:prepilin-type N-terminal cleavage/methylation domain-containing protein|nr:prepilin-type N-terminal cleavage/methylation domain-containing protein [Pyrinomonadaceae bacterium]